MSIALWTLYVAAVATAPSVIGLCPLHDVPARAAVATDTPHHPSGHEDHDRPRGLPGHDGPSCHCLGACSAASGAVLPSPTLALTLAAAAAPPEPVRPAPQPPLTAAEHLLPFANAPPAALG